MTDICLDPGHQAAPDLQPERVSPRCEGSKARCAAGTRGTRTGTPEHQVALALALKTRDRLAELGLSAVLTREEADSTLSNRERAQFANRSGARLCLRLHCDGVREVLRPLGSLRRGVTTLVPAPDCLAEPAITAPSARAAAIVHQAMLSATGFPSRGVRSRADLAGFNWSLIPVILSEAGFLTHPFEERCLVSEAFQTRLSRGIAEGLSNALSAI